MTFTYDNLNVNFDCFGVGERLVLIHGWGGAKVWDGYVSRLVEMGFQVFVISLPGFDNSDTPQKTIDSYYYAELLKAFLDEFDIQKPVLMGHSLGGKVITILESKYQVASKMILTNSAGYRRFYLGTTVKIIIAKIGKFFLKLFGSRGKRVTERKDAIKLLGSADYLAAGEMRASFRKIIGEDIRDLFKRISVPTLIIWGDGDFETPLIDGVQMNRAIKGSQLKIIKDANHFPFIYHTETFFNLIREFLNSSEQTRN